MQKGCPHPFGRGKQKLVPATCWLSVEGTQQVCVQDVFLTSGEVKQLRRSLS
jgi:hypothetical protein